MPPVQRRRPTRTARGSTLPPIIESSQHSPQTTPPRGINNTANKENPFRQLSQRQSGPMATSVTFNECLTRNIGHRKSIATTIDLSKSELIMKKVEKKRRESMVSTLPGRRISFGTIGTNVTTLLRAKHAFAQFKKRPACSQQEDTPDDKAFEIETLPRRPRFASTLSAEAQYAIMKGYEDKVYGNLCQEFPEYRPMLRRNRTPHTGGIVVCPKRKNITDTTFMKSSVSSYSSDVTDKQQSCDQTSPERSGDNEVPVSTSTQLPECETPTRSNIMTSPVPRTKTSNLTQRTSEKEERRIAHAAAKEKQLIMTYRYHCAMDILDDLRKKQGMHSLSPRMKKKEVQIEPLKDYNSWAYVWNHEFEPKKILQVSYNDGD